MQSCQQNIFMNSEKLTCYLLLFFLFFPLLTCNSDCTFVFFVGLCSVQCPVQALYSHDHLSWWVIPDTGEGNSFCLVKGSFCLCLLNCHSSSLAREEQQSYWPVSQVVCVSGVWFWVTTILVCSIWLIYGPWHTPDSLNHDPCFLWKYLKSENYTNEVTFLACFCVFCFCSSPM